MNNDSDSPAPTPALPTPSLPPAQPPAALALTSRFPLAQIPAFPINSTHAASRLSPFAAPPPNALTNLLPHHILPIPRNSSIGKFTAVIPPFNGVRTSKPTATPSPYHRPIPPPRPTHPQLPHLLPPLNSSNGSNLRNEYEGRPRRTAQSNTYGHAMEVDRDNRSSWEPERMGKGYNRDPDFQTSRENSSARSDISDGDPPEFLKRMREAAAVGEVDLPGRRKFGVLEEIVFASPTSFTSTAFTIAEERGMALVITDDQTHKMKHPYMHICCSYRPAGCPFILKLIKAAEGGWVVKPSGRWESEMKIGSIYRCRHDTALEGNYQAEMARARRPAGPGRPKAPQKKPFGGSIPPAAPPTTASGRPERLAAIRQRESQMAMVNLQERLGREGGGGNERTTPIPPPTPTPHQQFIPPAFDDPIHDKALAPPFERSLALIPQIEPVLRPPNWSPNGHFDPNLSIYAHSGSPVDPRRQASYTPDGEIDIPRRYNKQSGRPLPLYYEPPRIIKLPPSPPECLPQWTALLQRLDPELVFLAPMMASPALGVTPGSFFDEDEEMRGTLVDGLECGEWHRIKFRAKMGRDGKRIWEEIKGMEFAPVVGEEDEEMKGMNGGPRRPMTMDTTPLPLPLPNPFTPNPLVGISTGNSTSASQSNSTGVGVGKGGGGKTRLPHEYMEDSLSVS